MTSQLSRNFRKKNRHKGFNKSSRPTLHQAASYNSPVIQKLLSLPDADANIPDVVLKWTPLRYAERTKSWMVMDILLQNGANPDDIALTGRKSEAQERVEEASWDVRQRDTERCWSLC